jgi:putative membrane protein
MYGAGVRRLWQSAGVGKGISRAQVSAFSAGWLALIVALVSPIDALSDSLLWVHMVQHELLMVVAAPLIALSSPMVAMAWAFRVRASRYGSTDGRIRASSFRGRFPAERFDGQPRPSRLSDRTRTSRVFRAFSGLAAPAFVFLLHAFALWIWHLPWLYEAALEHEAVHVVQHTCFFASACLFWSGMLHGRYGRAGYGAAVVYMFATAMHSGVLGALLTMAPYPWYRDYITTTPLWGYTPLQDQQVAGLIMWIPASIVFLLAGLGFLAAWLRESERRVRMLQTQS